MVDFKKRLAGKKAERPIDPVELYDTLDRAHDKGPLRPAQLAVLQDWFASHRDVQDVIVKLHTGQGKTAHWSREDVDRIADVTGTVKQRKGTRTIFVS